MRKTIVRTFICSVILLPAFASAQTTQQLNTVQIIVAQLAPMLTTLQMYINQLESKTPSSVTSRPNYFTQDQSGSIELGTDSKDVIPRWSGDIGIPYIDFHYLRNAKQDYNTRIINDGDKRLSIVASPLRVQSTDPEKSWISAWFSGNNNSTNHFIFQTDNASAWSAVQLRGKEVTRNGSDATPFVNFMLKGDGSELGIIGTSPKFRIDAGNVEIGTSQAPRGITLYDQTTRNPHCLSINNGGIAVVAGTCN